MEQIGTIPPETIEPIKEKLKQDEIRYKKRRSELLRESKKLRLDYLAFKARQNHFLRFIGEKGPAKKKAVVKQEQK